MKLVPVLLAAILAGCSPAAFEPGAVSLQRSTSSVVVRGTAPNGLTTIAFTFNLVPLGIEVSYSDDTGLNGTINLHDTSMSLSGTATTPTDQLVVASPQATLAGQTYDVGDTAQRNALTLVLSRLPLGVLFQRMLPYRLAVQAHMAETAAAFDMIGLAVPEDANGQLAWPPAYQSPADEMPPGMLPGDTIGLGMTCSSNIECPNSAPFCITQDHTQAFGFCSRSCLTDGNCVVSQGIGTCVLEVTDVPNVGGTVQVCAIKCGANNECPALLSCNAHLNNPLQPDLCFPSMM